MLLFGLRVSMSSLLSFGGRRGGVLPITLVLASMYTAVLTPSVFRMAYRQEKDSTTFLTSDQSVINFGLIYSRGKKKINASCPSRSTAHPYSSRMMATYACLTQPRHREANSARNRVDRHARRVFAGSLGYP